MIRLPFPTPYRAARRPIRAQCALFFCTVVNKFKNLRFTTKPHRAEGVAGTTAVVGLRWWWHGGVVGVAVPVYVGVWVLYRFGRVLHGFGAAGGAGMAGFWRWFWAGAPRYGGLWRFSAVFGSMVLD